MNLPGKKTVWDGSIILFATAVILLAITFVKILKLTFNMQIGLYCCIILTSCCFGISVITTKFKLYKYIYIEVSKHCHEVIFYERLQKT
jgi:ABC-type polysaccharide/polyol phosphate export permease